MPDKDAAIVSPSPEPLPGRDEPAQKRTQQERPSLWRRLLGLFGVGAATKGKAASKTRASAKKRSSSPRTRSRKP